MRKRSIILAAAGAVLLSGLTVLYGFPGALVKGSIMAERSLANVSVHTRNVSGIPWSYLEGGNETGPTVVLLHGFGLNKDRWGPLLRDLSGQFHIVAPDLPGFGATPAVEGQSHGARAQAERLAEFLNELGIRRFTLLGFSMGGGVAADYASRHADRVDRLILLSAYGVRTVEESEGLKKYKEDRSNGIYFKTAEGFDRVMNVASENPPFLPGPIKEYIARNIGAPHYSMHKRILEEMVFGDPGLDAVRSRLGSLTMPVLILFGNHDRIINPEAAGIFHRGIKGSEMAIVSNCGHMVYLDCADATNRHIEDFLTDHNVASRDYRDQVVRSDSDKDLKKIQP